MGVINYCPLSMFSGNPCECVGTCRTCPPFDFQKMAGNSDYLQCLNYPEGFFTSDIDTDNIADALDGISTAINAANAKETE